MKAELVSREFKILTELYLQRYGGNVSTNSIWVEYMWNKYCKKLKTVWELHKYGKRLLKSGRRSNMIFSGN